VTAALAPRAPVRGDQVPRIQKTAYRDDFCVECGTAELPDDICAGHHAVAFYRKMTGRVVMPWQELAVVELMAERTAEADVYADDEEGEGFGGEADLEADDWKWAASNAALVVARQNGKGDVLLIIELYHMCVLKARRVFHTAQLQRTATDAHKRMADIIRTSPKLLAMLRNGERGIRSGKGDERIVWADGREILFFTRSDNAGRGLFGDLLICDEAYDLTDGELAALRPMINTSPSPQVIYASTPVDKDAMANGYVLAGIRQKALAGAPRTTWIEWSVPERPADAKGPDPRLKDPRCWAQANPSLGMRIAGGRMLLTLQTIEDDLNSLGTRKFLVEDLCAPDFWPNPEELELEDKPFDPEEWDQRSDHTVTLMDPTVLGVDRSPGGRTSVVAAGWTGDGRWSFDVVACRPGTDWVLDVVAALVEGFSPAALVIDAVSPAAALIPKLQAEGIEPIVTNTQELVQACTGMVDDFDEGRMVPHRADPDVQRAVEIVTWRNIGQGGARAYDRKGAGDISVLVGAALAGWGLQREVVESAARPQTTEPVALESQMATDTAAASFNPLTVAF
jgi:hypothetical protein